MIGYKTCIHNLEVVLEMRVKIDIYDDSMLIICQVTSEWQTKDKKIKTLQRIPHQTCRLRRDKNRLRNLITSTLMAKIDFKYNLFALKLENHRLIVAQSKGK